MREWATVIGTVAPREVLLIPAVVLAVTTILLRCRRIGPARAEGLSAVDAALAFSSRGDFPAGPDPMEQPGRGAVGSGHGSRSRGSPRFGGIWPWLQLLGNVLLLWPLGALLPLRVPWFTGLPGIVTVAVATTCLIELFQFTTIPGRVVSTDDVLLNTAGASLGAVCSRKWWGDFRERGHVRAGC